MDIREARAARRRWWPLAAAATIAAVAVGLLQVQLVGDARQDVRHARAIERVVAGQVADVVAAGLRGGHKRQIELLLLALADDVHAALVTDAAGRQTVVDGVGGDGVVPPVARQERHALPFQGRQGVPVAGRAVGSVDADLLDAREE